MTEWEIDIDGERTIVPGEQQLDALLRSPHARSARVLALERVSRKRVPGWEKAVYRMLGLRTTESEAHGTMEVSFSGDRAFVVFIRNDDDTGVVATTRNASGSQAEFFTTAGEKFEESPSRCVSREQALAALLAFMRSAKRPTGMNWEPVGRRS